MPKTRKRIAAVVCAVLMTSSCMNPLAVAAVDEYGTSSAEAVLFSGEAASDIEINETTFPDATFRQYVIDNFDTDKSGGLSQEEIDAVLTINVSGTKDAYNTIASLKGIEFFTKLNYLYCDYNQLTSLDVSNNTVLKTLFCSNNQLTKLDVTKNTVLTYLNFQFNQISSIDLSKNTVLEKLICDHNKFTELDLTNNKALELIWCGENEFSSLDFSPNTALKQIVCRNNPNLASVNVSKNANLDWLDCGNSPITSIDVSNNSALTTLICDNNLLTQLNVMNNSLLTRLECQNNKLTSLDVSNITALNVLNCSNNSYSIGDVSVKYSLGDLPDGFDPANASEWTGATYDSVNKCLKNFTSTTVTYKYDCGNGKTETFTLIASSVTSDVVEINETTFPDATFRKYVSDNFDTDKSGGLTQAELDAVTKINVSGTFNEPNTISDLTGIGYFTKLTTLECSYNQLTSLDVSKNTALTSIKINSNKLTSLDISKNTDLILLWCGYNQLTSFDVSNNTALTSLDISGNQFTSLDVSNNINLTSLNCSHNQLTSLNVTPNTALDCLDISYNLFTDIDLSKNTDLTILYAAFNEFTNLDVSKNTALVTISVASNQLTSFDVSENTALTTFGVSGNRLTSLDVSKNTALTSLYCDINQLTSLDVSNNTDLTTLGCSNNTYSIGDVSRTYSLSDLPAGFDPSKASEWTGAAYDAKNNCLKNFTSKTVTYKYDCGNGKSVTFTLVASSVPEPDVVEINETTFPDATFRKYVSDKFDTDKSGGLSQAELDAVTEINVSGTKDAYNTIASLKGIEYFTKLQSLNFQFNQVSSIDLSKNTALKKLICDHNKFTKLDLTNNTALELIWCGENEFTSLDFSTNTALTQIVCRNNTKITSIDVSKNTKLEWLDCGNNQLSKIDVSKNAALKTLICDKNQLTVLDVKNNKALTKLECSENKLTSLDVSKNTALTTLDCGKNAISSLDVSKNTALEKMWCFNNQLTSLDVSKNTALTSLSCDGNKLTVLDLSKNTLLTKLDCRFNQLTSLDLSKHTALTSTDINGNSYAMGNVADSFSLTDLPAGFDPAKASEWNGAEIKDGKLVNITGIDGENKITYVYDCGNGNSDVFELTYTSFSHEHSFGEWRITTLPSADNDGVKERECTVCGYTETESVKYVPDDGDISNTTDTDNNACNGDLDLTGKEITEQIELTPEEREKVENGASVEVYLEVKEMTDNVPEKDKELIEKASTDMKIGIYLDISLFKKIGDESSSVKNTKSEVTINLTIPDKLINNDSKISREYFITRVHNGVVSVISGSFDAATKKFSFGTDRFSSYAISYKDTAIEEPDPITAFVERLYLNILNRPSDANKVTHIDNLNNGESACKVAYDFVFSSEFANLPISNEERVKRMYLTFLNREADPAGLADWTAVLDNGCSIGHIFYGFTQSNEFTEICEAYGIERGTWECTENRDKSSKLTAFVSRLYTKAMGRAYDVGGLNDHTGSYLENRDLYQLAYNFIFSSEFIEKNLTNEEFVDVMYRTFFDREADPAGKADWLDRIANQGYTREDVLAGFVGSQECADLVARFGI